MPSIYRQAFIASKIYFNDMYIEMCMQFICNNTFVMIK